MHTNHNRIKVSDLETDDPDKILVTNSKGELEFIPTKNIKVDSYNALDYDQEGKALDARQGKILKDLVNNKTDKGGFQGTAQDLANSIAALEMPDKVLKYGQINLSGLNLSIDANAFSWVLNQIQFLTPDAYAKTITAATDGMYRTDIVAGNNSGSYEIIKGNEAVTGAAAIEPKVPPGKIKVGYILVFGNTIAKLGNSQGVDLSGELQFPAYPNTRNDGQISMNKVFGTDMHGNLKMYTIATAPAPYLEELIPDSHLPSNTGNFKLRGSFFTPTMTIAIEGQIINYINFISDNEVDVNVTTGSMEGMFDVTLNNGLSATFPNALAIVLGTVYTPLTSEWSLTEPIEVNNDKVMVKIANSKGSAIWNKNFNASIDFEVSLQLKATPLGSIYENPVVHFIELLDVSDNSSKFRWGLYFVSPYQAYWWGPNNIGGEDTYLWGTGSNSFDPNPYFINNSDILKIRCIEGIIYVYFNGVLMRTLAGLLNNDVYLKSSTRCVDIYNIKYIELATQKT